MMHDSESSHSEGPSRSQLRREALAVFELAEALAALSEAELVQIPLSDELRVLVGESRTITSHIARKRQLQFLAKRMRRREDELPAIEAALLRQTTARRGDSARLHRIEQWRDRLIAQGDPALDALLAEAPHGDRQQLRQLVRRAKSEALTNHAAETSRALFRALRALLEA
jgi:ribosome-associated protein